MRTHASTQVCTHAYIYVCAHTCTHIEKTKRGSRESRFGKLKQQTNKYYQNNLSFLIPFGIKGNNKNCCLLKNKKKPLWNWKGPNEPKRHSRVPAASRPMGLASEVQGFASSHLPPGDRDQEGVWRRSTGPRPAPGDRVRLRLLRPDHDAGRGRARHTQRTAPGSAAQTPQKPTRR